MSSMHALIPIDEILNDIGSHVLKHFIYCHLMHALMSTCDPMCLKFHQLVLEHAGMTFELHIWVFPFFGLEAIFRAFFFSFAIDSRFSSLIDVGDL